MAASTAPKVLDSEPKLEPKKAYLGILVDHGNQIIPDISSLDEGDELILVICTEFSDFKNIPKLNSENGRSWTHVTISKKNDDSDVVKLDMLMAATQPAHYLFSMIDNSPMYQISSAGRLIASNDLTEDKTNINKEIIIVKLQKSDCSDEFVYMFCLGDGQYIPCKTKVNQRMSEICDGIEGFFDELLEF